MNDSQKGEAGSLFQMKLSSQRCNISKPTCHFLEQDICVFLGVVPLSYLKSLLKLKVINIFEKMLLTEEMQINAKIPLYFYSSHHRGC